VFEQDIRERGSGTQTKENEKTTATTATMMITTGA
jgi:hypothetical protein